MKYLKILILSAIFVFSLMACKSETEKRNEKIVSALENPQTRHARYGKDLMTQNQKITIYTPDSIDCWADPSVQDDLGLYLSYMNEYESAINDKNYYSNPSNVVYGRGGDYYHAAQGAENRATYNLQKANEIAPRIKAKLENSTHKYDDSYVYVFEEFEFKEYVYTKTWAGPYVRRYVYLFSKDGDLLKGPNQVGGTSSPFDKINSIIGQTYSKASINRK